MANFRQETYAAIKSAGYGSFDVLFIGTLDGRRRMTMAEFDRAADFEYDNGYGATEIPSDLIVYFRDGRFIKRWGYDGSEGWDATIPGRYTAGDPCEVMTREDLGGPPPHEETGMVDDREAE